MGIKSRAVQPDALVNYLGAMRANAATAVDAGDILAVTGSTGGSLSVAAVDCDDDLAKLMGRLYVALYASDTDGSLTMAPWSVVALDTSSGAVDDLLYLSNAGAVSLAADTDVSLPVGRVVVKGDATDGRALVFPGMYTGLIGFKAAPTDDTVPVGTCVANTSVAAGGAPDAGADAAFWVHVGSGTWKGAGAVEA